MMKKTDASHEEQAKDMEKKVHEILEQSAMMTYKEEHAMGELGVIWQASVPVRVIVKGAALLFDQVLKRPWKRKRGRGH